ncbi:MAG: pyridoxal-phosphate dependent enzyme [Sediminibacterium sp.]|nr:pyridoxal-phosphate dependent enzyme [Sediminibacterium sp.]
MQEAVKNIQIEPIRSLSSPTKTVDLLRLDLLHPIISGNKWFKLRYYLADAQNQNKKTIASFGGAYSNHLVAMAYSAKMLGLNSVGIIRGEAPKTLSPTLTEAISYGMQPIFVSRLEYAQKELIQTSYNNKDWYWINEGGYGIKGALGAATILTTIDADSYTNIICATGTGTMMAGLIMAASPKQKVTGISVLKNHFSIQNEVEALLKEEDKNKQYEIIHGFDFGGYVKHPMELIQFMNEQWQQNHIPTDFVYTGKLLYGITQLMNENYFGTTARILVIHSGGIQGNRSLSTGQLIF